jgi:hypothetical protein
MDIVTEEGATFFDHNRPPFVSVELPYAPERDVRGPQRWVMVNPHTLDYETIIRVPLEARRRPISVASLSGFAQV